MNSNETLVLGIDIGTSSLKLIILNPEKNKTELELNESTISCNIKSTPIPFSSEQDVTQIIYLVNKILRQIPSEILTRIRHVQLCGQVNFNR